MTDKAQRQKGSKAIPALNMAINGLNIAKEATSTTPVNPVFGSVALLLTMIRDTVVNEQDYVDLGLSCADICKALERGMDGKALNELSQSVCDAINQLTTTVAEIQGKVLKRGGRGRVNRFLQSRDDKDAITAWKSDLNRILHVFNTELTMNTYTIVTDIRQDVSKLREGAGNQDQVTQNSVLGELPPPAPRIFFGRDEFIGEIVHLAEGLKPIALIGAGGIGKTSIILTALHDERIEERFGNDRRFIRCDEFPATRDHFLRRLSKVVGAGIENPENLAALRPFLSSKEVLIVLDNAESILDPQGPNAREIHADVDELTQIGNICIWITSRISTIPPDCETIEIPTLSTVAAGDTFYRIYKHSERSDSINYILERLEFHPLSITLLATVAQQSKWSADRLTVEWEKQRTRVLNVQHSKSLANTIELSLSSPMFRELGPDARLLLEVVAFFPQGVNEKNANRLFPTILDIQNMLDGFCILSLAHRNNGFLTMLAPLRDHLRPEDPSSSPLLNAAKESYFGRLSGEILPGWPGFEEARWIATEDINVEYLLDVFTTVDPNSETIWNVCDKFMAQLYHHKPRPVMLGPKIEALPDNHPSKARCLMNLSRLFSSVGNYVERRRLLRHSLKLWRERRDDFRAAQTLKSLSDANRMMGLSEEGILQAKEASEIFERLGNLVQQADSLIKLASLLRSGGQLDAAEEAGSRALDLLPEKGQEVWVCQGHRILGQIYQKKGEAKKAIHHFEKARGIASSLNMVRQLLWVYCSLAEVFSEQGEFEDAQTHLEHAKSHAGDDTCLLAYVMTQQAQVWNEGRRFEEARSEALRALDAFEKLGDAYSAGTVRELLQDIDTRRLGAGQPS